MKQVKLFETHQFCIQKLLLASKKIEIKEFVTIYPFQLVSSNFNEN